MRVNGVLSQEKELTLTLIDILLMRVEERHCGVVTEGGDGCGVVTDGGDGCNVVTDGGDGCDVSD